MVLRLLDGNEIKAFPITLMPDLAAAESDVNIVEVSGTDPVITGAKNTLYTCDEVTTLSLTPPSTGSVSVIFTSGSTPTTLTLPATVKMPDWFVMEANRIYEINIVGGIYGAVMSWATT